MDIKKELDQVQKKIDEIKKSQETLKKKLLIYRRNKTKKWRNDHIVVVMR